MKSVFIGILFTLNVTAIQIENYYGNYDISGKEYGKPTTSLLEPVIETWKPLTSVTTKHHIAVLLPHIGNSYWLAINYALLQRAKELGINLHVYSAHGYDKDGLQKKQLTREIFEQEKIKGVILASVHYDKLDRFIEQISDRGIPVVALVNDVLAPKISAKVLTSPYTSGYKLGEYIIRISEGRDLKIAFFPGPKDSGWAPNTFSGFVQAIKDNFQGLPVGKITVVAEQYGKMLSGIQKQLVDHILKDKDGIDYIIANPIAAKLAITAVANHKERHPNTQIIATYLSEEIYNLIKSREITAATTDMVMQQAKIAIDILIRIMQGEKPGDESVKLPFRSGPVVQILDRANLSQFPLDMLFAPADFKEPIYTYLSR